MHAIRLLGLLGLILLAGCPATATTGGKSSQSPKSASADVNHVATGQKPTVFHVGPDRATKTVSQLVADLKPGDVVEVDPGVYREAMKLKVDGTKDAPITIRGMGPTPDKPGPATRPVFDAEGVNVTGVSKAPRAIFQIEGAYCVLEHLELKNARNADHVAAGVRLNGSTNAVIRDCYSHHNDLGVFGNDEQTATIDSCEVAFNSTKEWNGYAHNFYMHGNRVVLRNCYLHDVPFGQNFKTRAHYNELWNNWIVDSDEGEVGPVDEHPRAKINTGLPNSNVLLVGNVIVSKPRSDIGNPSKFILFGAELKPEESTGHNGTLFLYNNTLVAGNDKIIFIQLADPKARLVCSNNIFYGSDRILNLLKPAASIAGSNNLMPCFAKVPAEFKNTILEDPLGPMMKVDPLFVDAANRDFRLMPGSPAIDAGLPLADLQYTDGDGQPHTVTLDKSPWPDMAAFPRKLVGPPDLGAYELGAARPGKQVSFFGVPAGPNREATKIVYVIDSSGSMNATLDYVKAELKYSIGELDPGQQFQVLMFSEGQPKEFKFKGKPGLQKATADVKQAANEWIESIIAMSETGQTLVHKTIKSAFKLNPDLIYLLTDGSFDGPDVPALIRGENKDKKVIVNTILFREHDLAGEAQLKKIAQENGGVYKFIREEDLGKEYR